MLAGAAAGCGGEAETSTEGSMAAASPGRLTGAEQRLLLIYDRRIQAHCVRVTRSLVEPRATPTAQQEKRAFAAADALIALAAEKPAAPLEAGSDTRLFLSDVLENLGGSNCDPRMIDRLAQGLAQIPVQ